MLWEMIVLTVEIGLHQCGIRPCGVKDNGIYYHDLLLSQQLLPAVCHDVSSEFIF